MLNWVKLNGNIYEEILIYEEKYKSILILISKYKKDFLFFFLN
jgi:hypothetical protein